ncbi:MAG TPA: hypothetical protein VGJ02_01635 [Pyrinomonadaceae bacterium]|jgi:hypothetical protein
MRKILLPLLVLIVVGLSASAASAQWRELGSKEVDYNLDHDTMNVTAMKGDVRRIRIGVSRAPVRFIRIVLTYGNGNTQEVPIRSLIRAGGYSRNIDLKGRERVINKVDFWYESASMRRQKAVVTLYGRD